MTANAPQLLPVPAAPARASSAVRRLIDTATPMGAWYRLDLATLYEVASDRGAFWLRFVFDGSEVWAPRQVIADVKRELRGPRWRELSAWLTPAGLTFRWRDGKGGLRLPSGAPTLRFDNEIITIDFSESAEEQDRRALSRAFFAKLEKLQDDRSIFVDTIGGGAWTCGTQSSFIIALRGEPFEIPKRYSEGDRMREAFARYLALFEGAKLMHVKGSDLAILLKTKVLCEVCGGAKSDEHRAKCKPCNGKGRHQRIGIQDGTASAIFDGALLARILEGLDCSQGVALALAQYGEHRHLLIDGGAWRVILSPLSDDSGAGTYRLDIS